MRYWYAVTVISLARRSLLFTRARICTAFSKLRIAIRHLLSGLFLALAMNSPVSAEESATDHLPTVSEELIQGCWERNKSEEQSNAIKSTKSLPYAFLCFSDDGGLRGFFVGLNGLGNDMASSWRIISSETVEINESRCNYVLDNDHMKLSECHEYAGKWTKKCPNSRLNGDHDGCL